MTARLSAPIMMVLAGLASVSLGGCASHVKGSWTCALEPGVVCGSISDIDRGGLQKKSARTTPDPVIEGAIPARLWGQGGWTAGPLAGAPLREPDPVLKVALAPWVDAEGDYHAETEIYAVMRRGAWYVAPRQTQRRVDLARLPSAPAPADPAAKGAVPPTPAPK